MTDVVTPPWLEGPPSSASVPTSRWYKGMPSPNRAGRPRGIVDRRAKVTQALVEDADAVARVVAAAALEGDLAAASMVLARIAPPLRPATDKVQFALSPKRPLSEQAAEVLSAVAAGHLDPETGKMLVGCIQSVAGIRAVEDLEARIITLEATQL